MRRVTRTAPRAVGAVAGLRLGVLGMSAGGHPRPARLAAAAAAAGGAHSTSSGDVDNGTENPSAPLSNSTLAQARMGFC